MINSLKKVVPFLIITLCLSVIPAMAEEKIESLQPWEGEFISLFSLMKGTKTDALYLNIAQEAQKLGKNYTADAVKDFNLKMYRTDFQRVVIGHDEIAYYISEGSENPISVPYTYKGVKESKFMEHLVRWHVFTSDSTAPEAEEYRYFIATQIHKHEGGQPHWHFRYGKESVEDLLNSPGLHNWWPTFVNIDFDLDKYIKGFNPRFMAKMLP